MCSWCGRRLGDSLLPNFCVLVYFTENCFTFESLKIQLYTQRKENRILLIILIVGFNFQSLDFQFDP